MTTNNPEVMALYPLLAYLSPEDCEDGVIYGLSPTPKGEAI
jgi:hypothetical protein